MNFIFIIFSTMIIKRFCPKMDFIGEDYLKSAESWFPVSIWWDYARISIFCTAVPCGNMGIIW